MLGRPNAGKSSMINALAGEERMIVSDVAGTTRDSVDVRFERDGQDYVFVDTAAVPRSRTSWKSIPSTRPSNPPPRPT